MEEKDRFELDLEEKTSILFNCQEQKHHSSCMQCDEVLECSIRKNYVKAVYASMSKGQHIEFEF